MSDLDDGCIVKGYMFKDYLSGGDKGGGHIYSCRRCRSHLAVHTNIISKSFQGRHGRAFLFGEVVNVTEGKLERRMLITGLHTVCDIFCKSCSCLLGWKYTECFEMDQKYKEGKYILESNSIVKENSWDQYN